MTRIELNEFIKAITTLRSEVSDKEASSAIAVYPTLRGNNYDRIIKAGTRIHWGPTLKRAAVDLHDVEAENPDNAPTLWEDINYVNGIRKIPEAITPGLAFEEGEKGWWNELIYISKINNNTWTPDVAPDYWIREEN